MSELYVCMYVCSFKTIFQYWLCIYLLRNIIYNAATFIGSLYTVRSYRGYRYSGLAEAGSAAGNNSDSYFVVVVVVVVVADCYCHLGAKCVYSDMMGTVGTEDKVGAGSG